MSIFGLGIFASVVLGILKVADVGVFADWSWWLVTAPAWVTAIITAVLLILAVIGVAIVGD